MKLQLAPKPKNGKLQRARKWAEAVQFIHVDIKEASTVILWLMC